MLRTMPARACAMVALVGLVMLLVFQYEMEHQSATERFGQRAYQHAPKTPFGEAIAHFVAAGRSVVDGVTALPNRFALWSSDEPDPLRHFQVGACHRPWEWDPSQMARVQRAVRFAVRSRYLQMDAQRQAETAPGELRDAAEKASFHMSSAKMPLSSNPKVLLYNRSVHAHTGLLAYQQQLEFQGWEYYILGDDIPWRGPITKLIAFQEFLRLVHPSQLLVVTHSTGVLALQQPTRFVDKFQQLQFHYSSHGDKEKVVFSAASDEYGGSYEYFRVPRRLYARDAARRVSRSLSNATRGAPRHVTAGQSLHKGLEVQDLVPELECLADVDREGSYRRDCLQLWNRAHDAAGEAYADQRAEPGVNLGYKHLHAGLYAGSAAKLEYLWQQLQAHEGDDDQVLLKEFWFVNNDRIVLDYNMELFAVTQSGGNFYTQYGWMDSCSISLDTEGNVTTIIDSDPVFAFIQGRNTSCFKTLYRSWRSYSNCGKRLSGTDYVSDVDDVATELPSNEYYNPMHSMIVSHIDDV